MVKKAVPAGRQEIKKKGMPGKMLEQYMPLVNSIASMVSGKGLPPSIDFNDLVSDGVIGLMKAWENFDPDRGVKFETYASYRIRGEILDGLRYHNPVPYRVQVMIRDMAKKGYSEFIKERDLRLPKKKELSEEEFKSAVAKIRKIISASALMYLLSLEEVQEKAEVEVEGEITPPEEVEFSELRERLKKAVSELPSPQKEVVEMFYHKGISQKDIAQKLDLSRPKVNRLLGKAVTLLREKLR